MPSPTVGVRAGSLQLPSPKTTSPSATSTAGELQMSPHAWPGTVGDRVVLTERSSGLNFQSSVPLPASTARRPGACWPDDSFTSVPTYTTPFWTTGDDSTSIRLAGALGSVSSAQRSEPVTASSE